MKFTILPFAAAVATAIDAGKSFQEICFENGYQVEQYTVVTPDDYILSLYRIPGTFSELKEPQVDGVKPAVLFVHALDSNMMEYIMNDADKANAFVLANQGYDVWLGNNRGSFYSQGHLSLSTDDREYWNYWQADLGLKDVPTFIDHILDTTGLDNLSYIGHSQGTTQMFLAASMNPEYFTEKVNLYIALAPVASTANLAIPEIRIAAHSVNAIVDIMVDELHFYNWFPQFSQGSAALDAFCSIAVVSKLCEIFVDIFINEKVDNVPRFEMGLSTVPGGQTWRTFFYYAQAINSGNFTLYDYGPVANLKIYGQETAPAVPLEDYNIPTVLLSGDIDPLATPKDVAWLSEQLGDKVVFQKEYHLTHEAFVLANDMSFFTVDAVQQLQKFNPTNKVTDAGFATGAQEQEFLI